MKRTLCLIPMIGGLCVLADDPPDTEPAPARPRVPLAGSFFGAPPPIPHFMISERSSAWCLQCHALENRIAKRQQAIAPVPHREFSQCLQCHVVAGDDQVAPFQPNNFVGLDLPGKGSRAHPMAPPTMPHQQFMRENCLSCHGEMGDWAIRSPHPVRSQCQQCHVPTATADYTRHPLLPKNLNPTSPTP